MDVIENMIGKTKECVMCGSKLLKSTYTGEYACRNLDCTGLGKKIINTKELK